MLSDGELLRRYVEDGSQPAFTELVQRHINMIYIAALRQVGRNAHTADDVTQSVFTDLARKAGSLRNRPNLAGWLYTGTRFAAADAVRAERRRRVHEQETATMTETNSPPIVPEDRLEPLLDEVMALLPAQDRDVILLHFFEGRSFPEVGSILALSADAIYGAHRPGGRQPGRQPGGGVGRRRIGGGAAFPGSEVGFHPVVGGNGYPGRRRGRGRFRVPSGERGGGGGPRGERR